jgi:hypothetical protein
MYFNVNKHTKVWFLLCLLSAILMARNINDTLICVKKKPDYLIHLKNRSFEPEPGIERALIERLASSKIFPVHGMIQVNKRLSSEDRLALSIVGIHLLQFLGGSAYLAEFSKEIKSDTIPNFVRWAGVLLPKDKIENALLKGKIEDWARVEGDRINVVVLFHENVNQEDAIKAISKYTTIFKPHGAINDWAIEIPQINIKRLADEEIVKWIEQGPLPFMPLDQ